MYKIIILEDESQQLSKLLGVLSKYREENPSFEYSYEAYDRGINLLTNYKQDADIIFLDIKVPDMLGMDVAKRIRGRDENVMIIFVTNLTQYAVEGYSVNAFDYILKPLQYASFSAKLSRALKTLSYKDPGVLIELKNKESGRRVSADSITYVESCGHDLLFHMGTETVRQWGTLGKYELLLEKAKFARCNASFLVNLKYVEIIRKDDVVVGGATIPISRGKRKDFLAAYAQYKGGTL